MKHYRNIDLSTFRANKPLSIVVEEESNHTITSIENPFILYSFSKDEDFIYINKEYFIQNYHLIHLLIQRLIEVYRFSKLNILSSALINDDILKSIANNPKIMFITLGTCKDVYTLDRKSFDILNTSSNLFQINTDEVDGVFNSNEREFISWFNKKKLFSIYSFSDLENLHVFHFDYPLLSDEIKHLEKYLRPGCRIAFHYNNYENILKVISVLRNRNITFQLEHNINIMDYAHDFIDLIDKGENIIMYEFSDVKKMLQGEQLLNLIIKDIKNSNLSNYKKYLAIYDLVKQFKSYQNNPRGSISSTRDIYEILFNDFIVCEGYTNLLSELLNKVGIMAMPVTFVISKEKEELSLKDEATLTREEIMLKKGEENYHSRLLVHLIDEDMNINGYYIADPTWDNNSKAYRYVNKTPYEVTLEGIPFKTSDINILMVNNSEEFMEFINKKPSVIPFLKNMFYKLDHEFYKYLDQTYDLDNIDFPPAFYLDIYNYIITFMQEAISKEQFVSALKDVYRFIYVDLKDEVLENMIQDVQHGYVLKNVSR